jgi:hypothetical protein
MNFTFIDFPTPNAVPIYVDASLLKKSFCETAFLYTLEGLRRTKKDDRLTLGTAVHHFAARSHTDPTGIVALAEATDLLKGTSLKPDAVLTVASAMPRGLLPPPIQTPKLGVEFYFEVPWLEFVVDGTPYNIHICGTMDHLSFHQGIVKIYDYKTARHYKVEDARASYQNDTQFLFYPWAIWKFGHRFLERDLHNAARDLKLTTQVVIVQIALKPPRWTVDVPVPVTEDRLTSYEAEVRAVLSDMMDKMFSPEPARMNGWVNNGCPRCDFNILCHAAPGTEDAVRERLFHKKQYTPKNHS